ncbi:MAG TPA: glutaredoxin family protein [Myxococcota bacterium]|nr:glutaredoxin family protein [Myxococcota bacterium]
MIRRTLLLAALLLACSPASDDAPAPAAAPAETPSAAPPAASRPKPARERAPQRRSEGLQAGSGYYQYVDENGRVQFAARLEQVPERLRGTAGHISVEAPAAAGAALAAESAPAAAPHGSAEVVLYTTSTCPYCRRAIAYLDQIGQSYTNKNIEDDSAARDDMLALTGGRSGVPVIVVGETWMQGWNQQQLDQLLAAAP